MHGPAADGDPPDDHLVLAAQRPSARRAVLVMALTLVAGVVGLTVPVAAQDAPPDGADGSSTTTSPPSTVVLDDGDFGVVPPGGNTPPSDDSPPEGPSAPDSAPPPSEGEVPVPDELPVVILPDPTPGLNAALAGLDVSAAEHALADAEAVLRSARSAVDLAVFRLKVATTARGTALRQAVRTRSLLQSLAVNALVYGDVAAMEPTLRSPDLALLRDAELRDVAAEFVGGRMDRAIAAAVTADRDQRASLLDVATAVDVRRAADHTVLERRHDLDEARAAAQRARQDLGPAIMGPSVVSSDSLVAWYRRFYPTDPPVAPIEVLIESYLRIAAQEGIAGDIAFAQAILETGGFRSEKARNANFAGIGAYDECAPSCGWRFPGIEAGVRAHIHLLRAYADPSVRSSDLAAPPDPRVAPERVAVRGCCPRWTTLTGVWATDPNYDRKVLGIYRLMVETARAMALPPT